MVSWACLRVAKSSIENSRRPASLRAVINSFAVLSDWCERARYYSSAVKAVMSPKKESRESKASKKDSCKPAMSVSVV